MGFTLFLIAAVSMSHTLCPTAGTSVPFQGYLQRRHGVGEPLVGVAGTVVGRAEPSSAGGGRPGVNPAPTPRQTTTRIAAAGRIIVGS